MRFYVYALKDSRDGQTFYIGKGQKRRAWQHEIDARKGKEGPRFDRIRELLAEGLSPRIEILKRFSDEMEAYTYEATLIREGRGRLLNVGMGGFGTISGEGNESAERAVAKAIGMFVRLTANFTKPHPVVRFHNGLKQLPESVTDMAKAQLKSLISKHGADWFTKQTGIVFA